MATNTATAQSEPTDKAPYVSFFDEACKRRGLDPISERKKHDATMAEVDRAQETYLSQRRRRESVNQERLADILADVIQALQRPDVPRYLVNLKTPEELKDFLLTLLFDDIVAIVEGVMEGRSNGQ